MNYLSLLKESLKKFNYELDSEDTKQGNVTQVYKYPDIRSRITYTVKVLFTNSTPAKFSYVDSTGGSSDYTSLASFFSHLLQVHRGLELNTAKLENEVNLLMLNYQITDSATFSGTLSTKKK